MPSATLCHIVLLLTTTTTKSSSFQLELQRSSTVFCLACRHAFPPAVVLCPSLECRWRCHCVTVRWIGRAFALVHNTVNAKAHSLYCKPVCMYVWCHSPLWSCRPPSPGVSMSLLHRWRTEIPLGVSFRARHYPLGWWSRLRCSWIQFQ